MDIDTEVGTDLLCLSGYLFLLNACEYVGSRDFAPRCTNVENYLRLRSLNSLIARHRLKNIFLVNDFLVTSYRFSGVAMNANLRSLTCSKGNVKKLLFLLALKGTGKRMMLYYIIAALVLLIFLILVLMWVIFYFQILTKNSYARMTKDSFHACAKGQFIFIILV